MDAVHKNWLPNFDISQQLPHSCLWFLGQNSGFFSNFLCMRISRGFGRFLFFLILMQLSFAQLRKLSYYFAVLLYKLIATIFFSSELFICGAHPVVFARLAHQVKFLLEAGADTEFRTNFGYTALHRAGLNNSYPVVKVSGRRARINWHGQCQNLHSVLVLERLNYFT